MEALRIALCEDDPADRSTLLTLLEGIGIPTRCAAYPCGEALLKSWYPGLFDLILLDIFMGGVSGVETAAQVRARDSEVRIAFLTSSPDFTMDGYRNRVDRYLLKPVQRDELLEALRLAEQSRQNRPSVSVTVQGREQRIPHASISYAEQDGHAVFLHLVSGEALRTVMKLSSLAALLPSPPFCQFHKSFLVNLSHVRYLDAELRAFVMNGGGCAYIRRESLREAQSVYSGFMFDQVRRQDGP